MASLLCSAGLGSLAGLRILDVGCGVGATLRQYLEYEADPQRLWGIDLLPEFVERARGLNLQMVCGSASELPFSRWQLRFRFSIHAVHVGVGFRDEAPDCPRNRRVLVPGGRFLWYDFAFNNPSNPDVSGIRMAEVRRLFPGYSMTSRRITLAPPLGRAIGRLGPTIYFLTSKMRFLCTHYLCLLEKGGVD